MIILFLALCASCKKSDSQKVGIAIANPVISYVNVKNGYTYPDEHNRLAAQNVVTFTINNGADEKKLFLFDKEILLSTDDTVTNTPGNLQFLIQDVKGKVMTPHYPLPTFSNDVPEGFFDMYFYNDSLSNANYKRLGISYNDINNVQNFVKHSLVLSPNESRTFKVLLSLPIIKEINGKIGQSPIL